MAVRYGYIGWPGKTTGFPRLRLTFAALVSGPIGRFFEALKLALRSPGQGVVAIYHTIVAEFAGIAALPEIWFGDVPDRQDFLNRD